MKMLERSNARLRVARGGILTHACTFDRDGIVIVDRFMAIPFRRRTRALSDLHDIAVRRKARDHRYATVLQLRAGEDISLGLSTKEEALADARLIRDFLKMQSAPAKEFFDERQGQARP